MNKYSSLQEALSAHDIPYPKKEIKEHVFTRWGKDMEFFVKQIGEGYIFGNWKTGISGSWFPSHKKNYNKNGRF